MNFSDLFRAFRGFACFAGLLLAAFAGENPARIEPEAALARLREGNARFVADETVRPPPSTGRRAELARGQHPVAIVIACADSRVAPELLFDQGLGDLFVIRNAGNLLDDHVIGSVEYAVEHLHVTLVVVLGHSACGAVTAAVAGGEAPGHLRAIVESLAPAVTMARKKSGDALESAIRINAKFSAAALTQTEPLLREAVAASRLRIVAARYDLASGQVDFLP